MEKQKPEIETEDSLGDELHEEQEKKRRNRFIAVIGILVVVGGILLFFDNILHYFTNPRPKAGHVDKEGARVSRISEADRQIILSRVRSMIDSGKLEEARVQILDLLHRDVSPEAHYLAGTLYLRQGNIKGAYDHLKEATRLKQNYLEAEQRLGEIYVMIGDYKAATASAAVLAGKPDTLGEGLLLESEAAFGQGKLEVALQKALEAIKTKEAGTKQTVYLAEIYLRKGDRKSAAETIRSIDQRRLDAEGMLRLARYYLAAGDEERGSAYYKEALSRYPGNPEVHYGYAQYLFSRRKFSEATPFFQKAREALPNVQIISYYLGQSLLASSQWTKASDQIEAMLAKDPNSILAWRLKVQYHLARGERKPAIETLRRITQYIPDASSSYALLAELYLQEGVIALAEKNAKKSISLGDATASPRLVLGDVSFRKEDFASAADYYEQVLNLQPGNLLALLRSGDACLNLGQADKAEYQYRKAAAAYPNVGFVQSKLIRLKASKGDRAGFLSAARQSYERNPNDARAVAEYADALILNNKTDAALEAVAAAIRKKPQDWFLQFVMGDLYLLKRDMKSAAPYYERASALNPEDLNLALNLAARYTQTGLIQEAEEQYMKAYRKAPQNMPIVNEVAWFFTESKNQPRQAKELIDILSVKGEGANEKDTVGWYYFNTGDLKNAEHFFREALLLDPGNPVIRAHFALLLAQTKREREAVTEAQKIIGNLMPGRLKDKVRALISQNPR